MTEDEAVSIVSHLLPNSIRLINALKREALQITKDEAHILLALMKLFRQSESLELEKFGHCSPLEFVSFEKSLRTKIHDLFPELEGLYR